MLVQEVEMQEVSSTTLRKMLHKAAGFNADAMGDACGGGCGGRGANCHFRSEEMEEMVSEAD